jgi:hypothetical protein
LACGPGVPGVEGGLAAASAARWRASWVRGGRCVAARADDAHGAARRGVRDARPAKRRRGGNTWFRPRTGATVRPGAAMTVQANERAGDV